MKNILVPLGSNKNMKHMLQYAVDFAETFGSRIYVFRAYSSAMKAGTIINVDSIIEKRTKGFLDAIIEQVNTKNVEIVLVTGKGDVVDSVERFTQEYNIDLMIMAPRSNSIRDEVFLGNTSGRIVKHTKIPTLIVPEKYRFKPIKNILMAFKSGKVEDTASLNPLKELLKKFNSKLNLLLVKTPGYLEEDLIIEPELEALKTDLKTTENATTFQGVLEHFQSHQPDMLCVFRRKRGFFSKLWEKNVILKREFHSNVPLLILNGR